MARIELVERHLFHSSPADAVLLDPDGRIKACPDPNLFELKCAVQSDGDRYLVFDWCSDREVNDGWPSAKQFGFYDGELLVEPKTE